MRITSFLSWIGDADTAVAIGPDGTRYSVEFDGQTYWLDIDGEVQMDIHASMEDAQDAAETAAWIGGGRLDTAQLVNSHIQGMICA